MAVTFYTAAGQNAFTVETRVGDYEVTYPLGSAEPTAIVVRARYVQTRANYARPAANDTLSYNGSVTTYFINDDGFRDVRVGGVCEWVRTWASLPATWSEPESYSFTYPGFIGAGAFGTAFAVSAINASGSNYVLSTTATGIAANDSVFVNLAYVRNSATYNLSFTTRAVAVSSGASVTIGSLLFGSGTFTAVSGTVVKATPARTTQLTQLVGSRLLHEYALSSTTALDTDLPMAQPFTPIDSTGNLTTVLSTGAATIPTSTAYAALITNGGELVAECERRRYMGNIYVRVTRLVPAR